VAHEPAGGPQKQIGLCSYLRNPIRQHSLIIVWVADACIATLVDVFVHEPVDLNNLKQRSDNVYHEVNGHLTYPVSTASKMPLWNIALNAETLAGGGDVNSACKSSGFNQVCVHQIKSRQTGLSADVCAHKSGKNSGWRTNA
jgi:hypothetical protein